MFHRAWRSRQPILSCITNKRTNTTI